MRVGISVADYRSKSGRTGGRRGFGYNIFAVRFGAGGAWGQWLWLGRALVSFALVLACGAGWGQARDGAGGGFEGSPEADLPFPAPDVFVTVERHAMGSDVVTVTTREGGYPEALLIEQCRRVGEELGNRTRALQVARTNLGTGEDLGLLRATFAVDGLIRRDLGGVDLQALARAFAGAEAPWTVDGMQVQFAGEPAQTTMVQRVDDGKVRVFGRVLDSPSGLEYRIHLLTQTREEIVIPVRVEPEQTGSEPTSKGEPGPVNPAVFVLAAASVLSLGALVYFALLRPRSGRRPR